MIVGASRVKREVGDAVGIDGVVLAEGIQGRAPVVDHAVGDRVDSDGRHQVLVIRTVDRFGHPVTVVRAIDRDGRDL